MRCLMRSVVAGIVVCAGLLSPGCFAAASRVITVERGMTRSIPPDFLGLNGNLTMLNKPWDDAVFVGAMRRIAPGNFRYPGGTIGNDWDWDTGWVDQRSARVNPMGRGLRHRRFEYTLANFAQGQKALGFTPVFMLNLITKDLDNQVAALRKAQSLGLPIRRVELGNEFYLPARHEPAANEMFPNGGVYARTADVWASAIKQKFPGVKVAAIGCVVTSARIADKRKAEWDRLVVANLKGIDALTIHVYCRPGVKVNPAAEAGYGWGTREEQQKQWDGLSAPGGAARMIGQPVAGWRNILKHTEGLPEQIELWVTEFSMHDGIGPARYIWANGLVIAQMVNQFLADPRVSLAAYHNAAGMSAGTYWGDADTLSKNLKVSAGQDVATEPGSLRATGRALQIFEEATKEMTRATQLRFPGAPMVTTLRRQPYPSLIGWTFSGNGKVRTLFVNVSSRTQTVQTAALASPGAPFQQWFADPLKFVVNNRSLKTNSGSLEKALRLPAYSITLIGAEKP